MKCDASRRHNKKRPWETGQAAAGGLRGAGLLAFRDPLSCWGAPKGMCVRWRGGGGARPCAPHLNSRLFHIPFHWVLPLPERRRTFPSTWPGTVMDPDFAASQKPHLEQLRCGAPWPAGLSCGSKGTVAVHVAVTSRHRFAPDRAQGSHTRPPSCLTPKAGARVPSSFSLRGISVTRSVNVANGVPTGRGCPWGCWGRALRRQTGGGGVVVAEDVARGTQTRGSLFYRKKGGPPFFQIQRLVSDTDNASARGTLRPRHSVEGLPRPRWTQAASGLAAPPLLLLLVPSCPLLSFSARLSSSSSSPRLLHPRTTRPSETPSRRTQPAAPPAHTNRRAHRVAGSSDRAGPAAGLRARGRPCRVPTRVH